MGKARLFWKGFKKGFRDCGHIATNIVNFILLLIVYVIGVGPTATIGKAMKKEFLELKRKETTYWKENRIDKKTLDLKRSF